MIIDLGVTDIKRLLWKQEQLSKIADEANEVLIKYLLLVNKEIR
jgi:hypothetical protein